MKHGIFALAALAMAGCATGHGPSYGPSESRYEDGYSDYRLDDNRYRVEYRIRNGDTQLAQDWALRRAAELTLDRRYDWFQIISRNGRFRDGDFDRYGPIVRIMTAITTGPATTAAMTATRSSLSKS